MKLFHHSHRRAALRVLLLCVLLCALPQTDGTFIVASILNLTTTTNPRSDKNEKAAT